MDMIIWDSEKDGESGNSDIRDDHNNYKLDNNGNYAFIVANYPVSGAHYGVVLFYGPDAKEIADEWDQYVVDNNVDYIDETETELQVFMEKLGKRGRKSKKQGKSTRKECEGEFVFEKECEYYDSLYAIGLNQQTILNRMSEEEALKIILSACNSES